MYFNSSAFFGFLAVFFLLHYLARGSLRNRNRLIVTASYVFYGWWDWRFAPLLLFSSLVDFYVGLLMEKADSSWRRRLLLLSLSVNLGVLGFFKYFDFFAENVLRGLETLGIQANLPLLNVILPVGISFFTFQSLGYTIDVYRGRVQATRDMTAYLAYVSFFPQLVAGPIERAANLLPQFTSARPLTKQSWETGTWLVLWGMFKKVVIADNLGLLVNMVYSDPSIEGPVIFLATVALGFQIYCDFSGYSDIARGVASWLGFQLMLNFNLPYFAVTPSDFWRRWHISLSSWFRDNVYIPLGGSRCSALRSNLNLLATMLLIGIWHGAGWNFILWGLWHGGMLVIFRKYKPKNLPQRAGGWMLTMGIIFYGRVFFGSQSLEQIQNYSLNAWLPVFPIWFSSYALLLAVFLVPLIAVEVWQKMTNDLMPSLSLPWLRRSALHGTLLFAILLFWENQGTPFIYFQF